MSKVADRKEKTKARLIKAVGKVLARDGFRGLGVNKVAKEAGVDKVLVYRYFGGLPELVSEFSLTVDFWPTADELLGPDPAKIKALPPDRQLAVFVKSFLSALRKRPLTRDILAWELLERNQVSKQLEFIREKTILEFFEKLDGIPDDDDLPAIIVLVGGAVNHLLIKSRINPHMGGVDLDTERGWQRIERGLDLLLKGVFDK